MGQIVSSARGLYSKIASSPLAFYFLKKKYYTRYNSFEPDCYKDIYSQLVEDGVVFIPNYISTTECEKWTQESESALQALLNGKQGCQYVSHRYPEYGVYRLLNFDTVVPLTSKFYEDEMIETIAKSYVGENIQSYQRMIEIRIGDNKESSADKCHFDDWKHRFKAFLYLSEVDEDNAPFRYLLGSHNSNLWRGERFWKEYDYFLNGRKGSYGHYTDSQKEKLISKYGFEEKVFTGQAGSLILVDTKGLHSGTPLKNGRRLVLANYFDVR